MIVLAGALEEPVDSILRKAGNLSEEMRATVRLLDASRVFGMDHIKSALQKAGRAFDNRQNVSDSLATETMLYMSGCRQIQEALGLLGLKKEARGMVCIADCTDGMMEKIAERLAISEDDSLISGGRKDLAGFGIAGDERSTLPETRHAELVLERVAGVDVKKK